MDFGISEKMQKTLATISDFVREELFPLERDLTKKPFRAMLPALKERREKVKSMGLWCPQLPKEYGGMGLSLLEHGLVSAELGKSPLGHFTFNCQAPDAGNMEILIEYGTQAQKDKYLAPLIAGEIRSCFSMTEPDRPGSNPTWMDTIARKDGGDYVIDGKKWFTTAADGASVAIVMAVTEPDAAPHKRASQIIVPTDTEGFEILRNIPIMGEVGDDWLSHSEVQYRNCRVPRENILGEEGAGFLIAQQRLGPGRIHHCMRWIGICERAFELLCSRAASRELSPGVRLGDKQIIQAWIAESRAEINAARLMVLQAAWKIDREGTKNAREEISLIKFYVAGVLGNVLDRAIQAHGALGITDDTPLAWWYRHERGARIYDGADEVHKDVVARRILRGFTERMGGAETV